MAEKVGIRIELENADEALKTLQRIESSTRKLGARKTMIQMEDGSLISVEERLKQIQDRLAALKAAKDLKVITPDQLLEMSKLNAEMKVLNRGLKDGTANAKTFKQVFNGISSKVAHVGSAMQSFGNAMTQLTSPFRRLTSGILMGAGFKVFDKFSEGLNSAFTRSDILTKYARNLQMNFGKSEEAAESLKQALNDAVEGLPTGLDEIVNMANQFTASMGDADRAAKLAIATNNAFLASQSGETARYQGMMQLRDVIGGKDMNAREWQSLAASMLPAIRMIGEEMGLTGQELNDYVASVQEGKVANQEFLDQLIKYGTSGKVVETARLAMDTWEAFFSRIGTAASRLGYGVITTLNELVETTTGGKFTSLNSFLDSKVIPAIDNMAESIQKWIKAHPDEIVDFFKNLSKIKVGNFLRGYAKGLEVMIGLVEKLGTALGKHPQLMSFLGGFFGVGGMLGRMSTIFGGLLKGTRHIWGGIGAGGSWLLKGKLGGIFGKIASIFGSKKSIQAAGETAKTIPSVADTFKGAFSALQGVMVAAGAVTLVSGAGFVAFKSVKSILNDLKDIGGILQDMTWIDAVHGVNIVAGIGVFTKIFSAFGEALGPQGLLGVAIASAASFLVAGSFAADMWAIKAGVQQIRDTIYAIDEVGKAITNMTGIGTLDPSIKEKFRTTIDAINEIKQMFVGKNGAPIYGGQIEAGLPTFGIGKVNALTNIANAISQMQNIVKQFNTLAALTVNDPSKVLEQIKSACDKLQGIRGPKNILKHTQKVADALIQIRRMAYHINKLAGTEVNTGGFATFVSEIKTALASLKELNGELMLDIEVKLSPLFASSVEGVKKNIKNAKKDIEKFKAPIKYNIPVSITFSVTTNAWAAIAKIREARAEVRNAKEGIISKGYQAKGGMIYRSGGGGVPWRRRGTDTVPAMLTPGEYVHNKRAVSAFGIDFMRKVNNLDMKGAMNELMHRAGHMANINRGATITNNNYNNQKVVINNSNAGAGYTFRTASRFVGAF